jgi:SAM-dependent methyltransferase
VNYDAVAAVYDRRYETNRFDGTRTTLREFIGHTATFDVLEVGCGTGHWLTELAGSASSVAGIDPSWEMLSTARGATKQAMLVRARAEAIPLRSESVDRVFTIHALHHFGDKPAYVREARRVLRRGGAVLTIGLDPHTGIDQWWVYDYFPAALIADRVRYPSSESIRAMLSAEGFVSVVTAVAQHIPAAVPFEQAVARGLLDRRSTSQLMVIGDDEVAAGMERLHRERPTLRADLRLMATVGWVPA